MIPLRTDRTDSKIPTAAAARRKRRREVTRPSSPYIYIFGLGLQHSPHGTQDGTQGDKPDYRRDFFFYSHLIPPISFQILRPEEQLRSKMGQCLSASKPIIEALLTELAKPAPGAHRSSTAAAAAADRIWTCCWRSKRSGPFPPSQLEPRSIASGTSTTVIL